MGAPRKHRKKYKTPSHPWQGSRIEEEKNLTNEFGFRNKKEIWKVESILLKAKEHAKKLAAQDNEQAKKEEKDLINKLAKYGILGKGAKLEDVLGLGIKDVAEKRLQTQVFKKGLAKTVKQARQFIIHGHILVNGKKMTVPSYLVKEPDKISFSGVSVLAKSDHPETSVKK